MPSYSTIVLALSAAAAAAPLAARSNVCGAVPSASSTSKSPLETFTNAQTAEQCYADCSANASCKSFLFGLVDGTIKCELFDVAAAQIPKQDSSNLIAFDKACASIPDVKPTTANPQGLAEGSTNESNFQASNTNKKSSSQQKTEVTATEKAATKVSQKTVAKVSQKAEPKASQKAEANTSKKTAAKTASETEQKTESKTAEETEQKKTSTSTSSKSCGAAPVGSGNVEPFNTPANVNSLEACIVACKKNTSCKSVEFGKLTAKGANICRFFSVEAAQIPKATSGQSFQVSDIACA